MMNLKLTIPLSLQPSTTATAEDPSHYLCSLEDDNREISQKELKAHSVVTPMDTVLTMQPSHSRSDGRNIIEVQDIEGSFHTPLILSETESECLTDEDSHNLDDIPIASLLSAITQSDEDLMFAENGYKRLYKICDSLQGGIYKAKMIKESITEKFVIVKKVCKYLTDEQIARKKCDESNETITFCIEENILKEAIITKHLTVDNIPTGGYIPKFIDFFESESHYYLVREYVDGITFKEFIDTAHKYIKDGRLDKREYRKCVKYLMWQFIATFRFLHDIFHCMHCNWFSSTTFLKTFLFPTTHNTFLLFVYK